MDLMLPGVIKISFFHILFLLGGILLKAEEPSKFSFLLLVMKKDTYIDIFLRRLLKTK